MISSDHIASSDLTKTFLLNLAKIEAIEARLGREDLDKGEMDTLVKLCHEILNEMQELHLTSYVDNVFIHHKTAN